MHHEEVARLLPVAADGATTSLFRVLALLEGENVMVLCRDRTLVRYGQRMHNTGRKGKTTRSAMCAPTNRISGRFLIESIRFIEEYRR
jgi:hypothetical protein